MPQTPELDASQGEALTQLSEAQWLHEQFLHFRELYPPDASSSWGYTTDQGLRERLQRDFQRAKGYGFVELKDVFAYLQVSLELGERFEDVPEYTWAPRILKEPRRQGTFDRPDAERPDTRGDRLIRAMEAQRVLNDAQAPKR
jgi:hypothetical protein